MSYILPRPIIDRIASCIRLAQSPGTEGERQAAVSAVGRLVIAYSPPILQALSTVPEPKSGGPRLPWRTAAYRLVSEHSHRFNAWENSFLNSINSRFKDLTEKQRNVLERLAARVGVEIE